MDTHPIVLDNRHSFFVNVIDKLLAYFEQQHNLNRQYSLNEVDLYYNQYQEHKLLHYLI